MLRLEWKNGDGNYFADVAPKSSLVAWGGDGELASHWLEWHEPKLVVSGVSNADTLLEAQQAAESALKDALKPYAELYARLGGEL
jgi:hypothetical protein